MREGGIHDRRRHVALVLGLHAAGRTGRLEVRSGKRWRRLHLIGGRPALSTSSVPGERLFRALEEAGVVDRAALRDLGASDLDEDGLARALVESQQIDPAELRRQRARILERAIGASLDWTDGTWSFADHGGALDGRYDPSLLPGVDLPSCLWSAVRSRVRMEEVVEAVSAPEAGPIVPTDRLSERLIALGVAEPLASLPQHLDSDGTPLDELFRRLPDRSGHLVVLLWLLEAAGAVLRSGRPLSDEQRTLAAGRDLPRTATPATAPEPAADPSPPAAHRPIEDPAPAAAPRPDPTHVEAEPPPQRERPRLSARKLAELVRADHRHRVDKDFYAFLDLPSSATLRDVRATAAQLSRPWEQAAQGGEVAEEIEALASDLVAGVRLVLATFGDKRKRREYDRRLEAGEPPLIRGLNKVKPRAGFSSPGIPAPSGDALRPAHAEARRLLEQGEWSAAIRRLSPLRQKDPSDVEVLADLGWASWKSKRDPDFIRLAVTFDSSNARALEYLGRVYGELGEQDKVEKIARTLLKVDSKNAWARGIARPAGRGRG